MPDNASHGRTALGARVACLEKIVETMLDEMTGNKRFINRRTHLCGCVTRFDTWDWRSVSLCRCHIHDEIARCHDIA